MHSDDPRTLHLVLVAGLESSQRLGVRTALERAAFQVEEITELRTLPGLCDELWPDLVLLGTAITGEAAAALCRELSARPTTAYVPVLLIAHDGECSAALQAGAFDCVAPTAHGTLLAHRAHSAVRAMRANAEVERTRALLAITQRAAHVGTFELFLDQERLCFSAEACRILGLGPEQGESISRTRVLELVQSGRREDVRGWLEQASHQEHDPAIECGVVLPSGRERFVRLELGEGRLLPAQGRSIAGVVHDITSQHDAEERVRLLIQSEGPVGLANRQKFLERLTDALKTAQPPREKIAVVVLHVDFASTLPNDSSEDRREQLVAATAARVKECIRDRDALAYLGSSMSDISVARIGAEELVVLLPGLSRVQDAYKVALRMQHLLREPHDSLPFGAPIAAAFGIAVAPSDASGAEPLLKAAEVALLAAREEEGVGIRFFTPSMNVSAFERRALEDSLRKAIVTGGLLVYYQPRVDIATNTIVGFEALVRWNHPELGMLAPSQFIPIAEESRLIIPLGEYVLRTACAQAKRWIDDGRPPARVSVNLSSVQFTEPDLEMRVRRALSECGLPPEWLELELTESILLNDIEATIVTLSNLKAMGVHLSIDDFGTGYSSLAYLKRFPIDALKIDQSFIRDVTTNPDDAAITTSIILMGRSLKLRVVAEGVETRSQLTFLRVLECDEAQGYLFSRPLPAEEAGALLTKGLSSTAVPGF